MNSVKRRLKKTLSLSDVLSYSNPDVVERYQRDFGGTRKEADRIFIEALKWLYLGYRAGQLPNEESVECVVTHDIEKIDDMWHTFILFTKDYTDFCHHHFGRYLHHRPFMEEESYPTVREMRRKYRRFYEFVYDTLGEQTFHDWYFSGRYKRLKKSH